MAQVNKHVNMLAYQNQLVAYKLHAQLKFGGQ